uniref:tryptophan 2,3-dioxygenase family protein n=1 Tax=Roseivirga sp. TaxID=1964215 RepID=UPI00404713A6
EEYGCGGLDYISYGIIMQEIERGDSGMRSTASVQGSLVMYPIYKFGNEEQRKKYLPKLASGEWLGCFGLTEPDHGSNPSGMTTNFKDMGDHYLLNGAKMWISNAPKADVAVVWAKSEEGRIHGLIVERGMEGFSTRLKRINNYFDHLCHSFSIMIHGMEKEQFLQFRMSLLPSSGFQSAQYRMIEIASTDMINLVNLNRRDGFDPYASIEELYNSIYWMTGATELKTGKKTLTLDHFEAKYSKEFIQLAKDVKTTNLNQLYLLFYADQEGKEELVKELRKFDLLANVEWPLMHYKSAVRYLQRNPEDIKATGGTNWQKYLPPRFQKVVFFPSLWSKDEHENWGKHWVEENVVG